jgi:16S rRNA processing protein RimM
MTPAEAFYIGYISKSRGLKGEVQIFFEFDNYTELPLEVLFIELESKLVPFFVASHKLHDNRTGYFFFDDFDHIDKIKAILKKKVYLPLDKMPQRDEDEFFFSDLEGFTAHDEKLGELGVILSVQEFPQQFVATVNYQNKEILFPLNEDFIVEIDEEEQLLYLDLPDGLLDVYLD